MCCIITAKEKKMIRAILFDFDDTLGNREVYTYKTFEKRLKELNISLDEVEKEALIQHILIMDQFGDVNKNYVRDTVLKTYGIDLGKDFDAWWKQHQFENVILFQDAIEVLTYLRNKGYKLGIITNGSSYTQNKKLEYTNVLSYVDAKIVSDDVGIAKPDPRIFIQMAEKLGVKAEECAFVGDMFHRDILGAKRAGMRPIWMWSHGFRMCEYPVERISSLSELKNMF